MEVSIEDSRPFSKMDLGVGDPKHSDENKSRKRADAVTVLADGNVLKLQKTRQRKIFSCVYCHSKKIKCSRDQPVCKNCESNNMECKYFVNERVSRGGAKKATGGRRPSSHSVTSDRSENYIDSESVTSDIPDTMRLRDSDYSSLTSNGSVSPTKIDIDEKKDHSMGNRTKSETVASAKSSYLFNENKAATDLAGNLPNYASVANLYSPNVKAASLHFQNVTAYATDPPSSGMLQAPVMNSGSNNITNKFFNTNYAPKTSTYPNSEDHFAFNMSSFSFISPNEDDLTQDSSKLMNGKLDKIDDHAGNGGALKTEDSIFTDRSGFSGSNKDFSAESVSDNNQLVTTNFVDGPSSSTLNTQISSFTRSAGNATLNNSLNPYASNPATTINYLYGTNVNYDNVNLLSDLIRHLPASKERSYELIDRYMSSVHILLPILVNVEEFVLEHDKYWTEYNPYSPSKPDTFSETKSTHEHFNFLQFYTLYFPVLYAATISEFEEYDNLLLNQDIDTYLKAFNKICQHYNYPHGFKTIPILLGNVIIQSTSPNPSTMEMSQIIRYAKFLHLHKDPLVTLRITDWKVIKFRRLLWWVIFGLDTLSSHNFCLPPVCRADDFNVLIPDDHDPVFSANGDLLEKRLNVSVLAMSIKFHYDRICSKIVYQLHNGLSLDITDEEANEIKEEIVKFFHFVHDAIARMTSHYQLNPPTTVQEMNIFNFVKNHSWSYVDRALMLLHKKILVADNKASRKSTGSVPENFELTIDARKSKTLALSEFEDTFGKMQETNIIKNFDNSSISQLRFNPNELFSYENLQNNLIPSILHNLNDFLKYNDFIKFGKFNWYIKRTIPLDSIILLLVIICVKFKYDFIGVNELKIYVQLISKVLFIFNRKYFKNEKYKRMLSLTNLTWEYILKKYNVLKRIDSTNELAIEFMDHQVAGFMNMSELFSIMDVPQPAYIRNGVNLGAIKSHDQMPGHRWQAEQQLTHSTGNLSEVDNVELTSTDKNTEDLKIELLQLKEKISYDLRNNFVDVNDYCTFYSSLESILNELMEYINDAT